MPEKLVEGYERFRKGYFLQNRDGLLTLAQGQSPRIALVSCCDSRVDPTVVFDASPGELFVVRNVANLVPPFEEGGDFHGTSAALEFAVTGLNVSDIVVLGHAQCGGIAALMDKQPNTENRSFIDHWMSLASPAREAALAGDPENRYQACEHSAIELSLQNLMTFPFIKSRVEQGTLSIHGWYYDLAQSTLSRFAGPGEAFVSLTDKPL
jgi:carbonic anhydrase